MTWTRFFDLHGGGGQKTDFSSIYIEADRETAIEVFRAIFDVDPTDYSCSCCGPDFSIYEEEDAPEPATGVRIIGADEAYGMI